MQIHSRVDFYAKLVALLGLGCLAVAGALIDSLPASTHLPAVPSVVQPKSAPSVLTVVNVSGITAVAPVGISITLATAAAPVRRPRPVMPAAADLAAAPPVALRPPSPEPLHATLLASVTPLDLPAASRASLTPPPPLPEAPPTPTGDWAFTPELPLPAGSQITLALGRDEDDGLFPGVFKRTGSSVSSSIGKARSSLVGAFRFVGHAVKRAF